MIPFNLVRTNRTHYFFFANKNVEDLEHTLKENMVTGWGILPLTEALHLLPTGTQIPPVYIDHYSNMALPEKGVSVLASPYTAHDMQTFLWHLLDHPETRARHAMRSEELRKQSEWESAMALDPSPWSQFGR